MRVLADANVAARVVWQLRELGHDVYHAAEVEGAPSDEQWLKLAVDSDRTVITDDKDFGELVFHQKLDRCTVVLLRLFRLRVEARLAFLATRWDEIFSYPKGSFIVVSEHKIRARKPPF